MKTWLKRVARAAIGIGAPAYHRTMWFAIAIMAFFAALILVGLIREKSQPYVKSILRIIFGRPEPPDDPRPPPEPAKSDRVDGRWSRWRRRRGGQS